MIELVFLGIIAASVVAVGLAYVKVLNYMIENHEKIKSLDSSQDSYWRDQAEIQSDIRELKNNAKKSD